MNGLRGLPGDGGAPAGVGPLCRAGPDHSQDPLQRGNESQSLEKPGAGRAEPEGGPTQKEPATRALWPLGASSWWQGS